MARLEIERIKTPGSGFHYTFKSTGLEACADFDPLTGVAQVKFNEATNMAAALEEVVDTLKGEANIWGTNPVLPLRIDINAGRFVNELTEIAPRFGFYGPQAAGEPGTESQYVRFRTEIPLAG